VQVTSVVVLCPTDEIRTRTEAVKGSAQFGRHLKEIVQQAVNF